MQINLINQYDVPGSADPIATYEKYCIQDPSCVLNAYREIGNDVTLLKNSLDGDILEREILVKPQPQNIPAPLRALVGDDAFDCIQRTHYDFASHRGSAQTHMTGSYLSDRLKNKAVFKVHCEDSAAPRTVSYDSKTEVNVSIFMLGSKIERAITDQMRERNPILRGHTLAWLQNETDTETESQES